MANIFNSISSIIKPGRIATAAETLGENEHKVAAGTEIILPSLLALMLKKGDSPEIEEVFKEGKKIKAWENYDHIWKGDGVDQHVNLGERMENRLLSPHSAKFNAEVGTKVGLKSGHADRLTNWVAGTIAAWFSGQIAEGKSYKSLLGELAGEKAELHKGVPADLAGLLGLGSLLGAAAPHKAAATHAPAPKKKGSLAWLWWLLGLILLALLLFFCFRSCGKKTEKIVEETVVTEVVKPVDALAKFAHSQRVLPDGTKVTMYSGHLESAVNDFLNSERFKNASAADLRGTWFEFTDIDFEHNSATVFQDASDAEHLRFLAGVLKKHPDLKVTVGAFGDKTGTVAVNYAISEKRAETIRQTLIASGIPETHVSIEGFGKEFATIPESATNAERAPDRDIAMRFSK